MSCVAPLAMIRLVYKYPEFIDAKYGVANHVNLKYFRITDGVVLDIKEHCVSL